MLYIKKKILNELVVLIHRFLHVALFAVIQHRLVLLDLFPHKEKDLMSEVRYGTEVFTNLCFKGARE